MIVYDSIKAESNNSTNMNDKAKKNGKQIHREGNKFVIIDNDIKKINKKNKL